VAKERNHAATYQRRVELARERGFDSLRAEREYRAETKWERDIAGNSEEWHQMHPGDWRSANPRQLNAFYEAVVEPGSRGGVTGLDRHNAVAYYIEFEDMSEDEAVDAMRENFGDSP
jgi:hypothetical protein